MKGVPPKEDHNDWAGWGVDRASFHDLSLREGVADGFRWVGPRAQNTHDAVCSPQWEDNRDARGDCYSRGDTVGDEILREISLGLRHFLDVRNLDLLEGEDSLGFLDPKEDKVEVVVGR